MPLCLTISNPNRRFRAPGDARFARFCTFLHFSDFLKHVRTRPGPGIATSSLFQPRESASLPSRNILCRGMLRMVRPIFDNTIILKKMAVLPASHRHTPLPRPTRLWKFPVEVYGVGVTRRVISTQSRIDDCGFYRYLARKISGLVIKENSGFFDCLKWDGFVPGIFRFPLRA